MQIPELERDIVKACLQYLELKGIFCWRQNTQGTYKKDSGYFFHGKKGVSDILGILPDGRFLAIEVKRPGGKMSEHQEIFQHAITDNGGVACCVTSAWELQKDIEEVLKTVDVTRLPAGCETTTMQPSRVILNN